MHLNKPITEEMLNTYRYVLSDSAAGFERFETLTPLQQRTMAETLLTEVREQRERRCGNCKWYSSAAEPSPLTVGKCQQLGEGVALTFGCVNWQPKEEQDG